MGPADDGGYYLLGLKTAHTAMFADIDWSTPRVAEQTRQRAREAGLQLVELGPWYDVDDAMSLNRLLTENQGYAARETVSAINGLGLQRMLRRPAGFDAMA